MIARKDRVVDYLTGQLIRENKIKPIVPNDRKGPSLKIRVRQPVGYSGTCFQRIGFRLGYSGCVCCGIRCRLLRVRSVSVATSRYGRKKKRDDEQGLNVLFHRYTPLNYICNFVHNLWL